MNVQRLLHRAGCTKQLLTLGRIVSQQSVRHIQQEILDEEDRERYRDGADGRWPYSKYEGMPRDWIEWMITPIDLSFRNLQRFADERKWADLKQSHQFIKLRHETLGPDLATAHFVMGKGGAVKFVGSDKWHRVGDDRKIHLPNRKVDSLHLEAVDAADTSMMYDSFSNFVKLDHLKYLSLRGCPHVDDFCLGRFHMLEHLMELDVSQCPNVSERGLATLHRVPNLRRLHMKDMPKIGAKTSLLTILLEEMLPECIIDSGVDYTDTTLTDSQSRHTDTESDDRHTEPDDAQFKDFYTKHPHKFKPHVKSGFVLGKHFTDFKEKEDILMKDEKELIGSNTVP